jgi:serine protease Do
LTAQIRKSDENNDVALLYVENLKLPALQWSAREPSLGEFLVTVGPHSEVVAIGTYSHGPRSLLGREQGFLGITPENHPAGVTLTDVTPGGAGYLAGLRAGDVVTKLNGKTLGDVSELVNEIRRLKPGSRVDLNILRGTRSQQIQATLAARHMSSEQAARFKMMNRLGALPSRRNSEFAWVLQHDTPLLPEQCGGPIVDLYGNVVGINIARQGRVASLAIPAPHAQDLVKELLQPGIMANAGDTVTK